MCPFSEPRNYLSFNIWVMNHRRTHSHVRSSRNAPFFSHCYTSTDGSEKRDSRAYIVKEFVHVRGRVTYAWTAWNSNRAQERTTFVRHDDIRKLGTVVAMRDIWKWISRRREKRIHISIRNALASNTYDVNREEREKYYYTRLLKREILLYVIFSTTLIGRKFSLISFLKKFQVRKTKTLLKMYKIFYYFLPSVR